jgi:3-oxoacyl-[acyl-carrier-protein] synthase-3
MAHGYIAGTGFTLPEKVLSNADLIKRLDTTEDWIVSHTGIEERRIAADEHNTSHLGAQSVARACDRTGWATRDIDLLICATSTPDTLIPATASWICNQLEVEPVSFDVNAACSGFVYGLAVATSLARSMSYERVALVTAEKYSRVTDYNDRATCIFFGDSAATVLLQQEPPEVGFEIVDLLMENVNEGAKHVTTPIGGTFRQDGRMVKEYALRSFEKSAKDIMRRNDLEPSQLRAFAGHQANMRVLETVAETVGVRPDQHWHNVTLCGNQGAAGVISAFCQRLEEHEATLRAGDLFLMTVFGSGFTTGSVLLRRIDSRS